MKIAFLNDIHFGARNDNPNILRKQVSFFEDLFFPYIEKNDIKTVVILGDFFDKRRDIHFETLDVAVKTFINPIRERDLSTHFIIGNHDTVFRNTNSLNSIETLIFPTKHMHFYPETSIVNFDNHEVLMVPWIHEGNMEHTLKIISKTTATTVFGHLELSGFLMYKNTEAQEGIDSKIFDKFERVFSGHYHTRSVTKNIMYLGCQYEMCWADEGDQKGFHVFDTDTKKITFVENPVTSFLKIFYNDVENDYSFPSLDKALYHDKWIKLYVVEKINTRMFNNFVSFVEKSVPIDLEIIEDYSYNVPQEIDFDIYMDNHKFICSYIDGMADLPEKDRVVLKKLTNEIYQKVITES